MQQETIKNIASVIIEKRNNNKVPHYNYSNFLYSPLSYCTSSLGIYDYQEKKPEDYYTNKIKEIKKNDGKLENKMKLGI